MNRPHSAPSSVATAQSTSATFPAASWFPAALWMKSLAEVRLLFAACLVVTFLFSVLFVWLTSQVELGAIATFLKALPSSFERLSGVPFSTVATNVGRLSIIFVHPVIIFITSAWCIARGSDCVSGEIGRGTMELLLAQPIRRTSIILVHAIVTNVGAALIVVATWCGLWVGLQLTGLHKDVAAVRFIPSAVNLFAFMFFLTAFSTLVSSLGRDRRRTVGLLAGFYLLEMLLKITARAVKSLDWLVYFTFLGAFEPQWPAVYPETAWRQGLQFDGTLLGLGLVAYVAAVVVFRRRDLPAPL